MGAGRRAGGERRGEASGALANSMPSTVSPIRSLSPRSQAPRVTGSSFSVIPLAEPRSRISAEPGARKSRTWRRDTSVSDSRRSQPAQRPIVWLPAGVEPLPGVRPLQDGDLRDRPGGPVGVPVACLGDGDAVAGLDAAVGDRERGVEGDPLAVEHGQRDGAG